MKKYIFLLLLLLFVSTPATFSQGKKLTESSKVSLLTCSPSDDAIYALFGHSGLRVVDDSLGIDYVFDYGIFDFDSSNFIYRFVKGETDYMVAARTFENFVFTHSDRSIGVIEQVLNLSLIERQRILDALVINTLPENRIYRYNFFYDNCATRPRDILVANVDSQIEFIPFTQDQTYRDLLAECLTMTPWSRFGINLVIGSGADKVITERQKDFLPEYLSQALSKAQLKDVNGNIQAVVKQEREIIPAENGPLRLIEARQDGIVATDYPLIVGCLLLLVSILVSYYSYVKKKKIALLFDSLLFLVAGLAGCIIFFLMFFSEHPCVDKNWNLVWLNPLALLIVPFFCVKSLTKCVISYHFVNFAALSIFLIAFAFIPQKLEIAFIPYILAIWLRSGMNLLSYRKEER